MTKARYLAVALLLVLSGCHKAQPEKQGQAGGEILPGSASDAMLPLDSVTSQPPLAPKAEKVPGASTASEAPEADVAAPEAPPAEPAKPAG